MTFLGKSKLTHFQKVEVFPPIHPRGSITDLYGVWILAEVIVESISNLEARTTGSIWHAAPSLLTKVPFTRYRIHHNI